MSRRRKFWTTIFAVWFAILPAVAAPLTGGGNSGAPAEQTELATSGRSLKQDVFSPVKGLATNVADTLRDGDYAKVLNNLHQFVRGVWTSRGAGWTKERAGTFNSGAAFKEFAQLYNIDNTTTYFFQVAGKLYTYDFSTHTETQVGTGFNTSAVGCFKSVFYNNTDNYILFCNGVQEPYYWNKGIAGGNFLTFGFPRTVSGQTFSKPKFCEVFVSNRLCFAGFDGKPNTVLIFDTIGSDVVNSPLEATDAGYINLPPDFGAITGLRTVRVDSDSVILLVACQRGVCAIVGKDATDFRLVELTRDFGVPSNRTWVEVKDTLYFLGTTGIESFKRSDNVSAEQFVKVSGHIQDIYNRIASSYADKSFVVHNPNKQEVQFWFCADSDTSPAHAICMSYNVDDPGQVNPSPVFSTADGISPTCGAYLNNSVYYGRSDGYLMTGYSGNDWDGTAINWDYVSPLIGSGSPSQNSSNRKFLIMTEGGDQNFTAAAYTLQTMSDGNQKFVAQDSRTITQTAASVPNLGTWQSSSTTTTYPKLFDFDSKGSGRYWCLRLKGTSSGQHIDLVGAQSIMTAGGWKQ